MEEYLLTSGDVAVFSPRSSRELGEAVCRHLGISLTAHEERAFEDGEHKTRPLTSVRGKDVFVIESLYGDLRESVNDKLCRLLFFLGALRDASAGRVTALVPYLCYARKDRKSKPRDPVTSRYVAALFEAMKVDRLVALDVHNLSAFQNAFRIPTEHLEAKNLFVKHFVPLVEEQDVAVVSPDIGGVKRAEAFRESLSTALKRPVLLAFMEKYRSAGIVSGEALIGNVAGKTAILIDDLISSGGTLARAAQACRERDARAVYAAATHGVFAEDANQILAGAPLEKILVANTIPPFRIHSAKVKEKLVTVDVTPLIASSISRIHFGGSIVDLLE